MKKSFLFGLFLGAALTTITFVVSSEVATNLDPVKISPQYYKVLLENDQVRVVEYHLKPGQKNKCIRILPASCTLSPEAG